MRVPAMLVATVLVLAACGDKKADGSATTGDTAGMTAPAPAPAPVAATGTTHEVQMIQEGTEYKYVPAALTIRTGDVVVFKSVSGGLHNVQFEVGKVPEGALAILNAAIPNRQGDMSSELVDAGGSVTISFAGAPAGDYDYFCLPHQTMGMKGKITVTS